MFFELPFPAPRPDYHVAELREVLRYGRHPVEVLFRYEKHLGVRAVYYVLKKIHLVGRVYGDHHGTRLQDPEPRYDVVIGVRHVDGHLLRLAHPEGGEGVCDAVCEAVCLVEAERLFVAELEKGFSAQLLRLFAKHPGKHPLRPVFLEVPVDVEFPVLAPVGDGMHQVLVFFSCHYFSPFPRCGGDSRLRVRSFV